MTVRQIWGAQKIRKDFLNFKMEIAEVLMTPSHLSRATLVQVLQPSATLLMLLHQPCDGKRYDSFEHFLLVRNTLTPTVCRIDNCKGHRKFKCKKCGV